MLPTFRYFKKFISECSKCLTIKIAYSRKKDSRGEYIVIEGVVVSDKK